MGGKPRILVLQSGLDFLGFLTLLTDFDVSMVDLNLDRRFRVPKGDGVTTHLKQAQWVVTHKSSVRRLCDRFDMVFCEHLKIDVTTVSKLTKTPIVVRMHHYEIDRPDLINNVNWENVARLVVVSHEYEQEARRVIKNPPPISMIYNGVDLDRFRFMPCNSGRICTYGVHMPIKGFYDLMLALRDYELHIGGSGSSLGEDLWYPRVLRAANQRFGLKHRFYGFVDPAEWLRDKEYFVAHSMEESFCLALVESMASGLICFCHDYPAAKEIIPDEYRYRYGDELRHLLEDYRSLSDVDRLSHKVKLRHIVEEKFDVKQQAESFRQLFHKVISHA
jgi:glycosyltransferase involved in cell wall biosynthesis